MNPHFVYQVARLERALFVQSLYRQNDISRSLALDLLNEPLASGGQCGPVDDRNLLEKPTESVVEALFPLISLSFRPEEGWVEN